MLPVHVSSTASGIRDARDKHMYPHCYDYKLLCEFIIIKINSNWHRVYFGTHYTWRATFICLFKWFHSKNWKLSLNCRLPQNWDFQAIKNLRKTFEEGNLNTWELTFSPCISLGYSATGLHIQELNLHFGDAEIS